MNVTQFIHYRIHKLKYKKKIIKYQILTKLLTQNKTKKDNMINKKRLNRTRRMMTRQKGARRNGKNEKEEDNIIQTKKQKDNTAKRKMTKHRRARRKST